VPAGGFSPPRFGGIPHKTGGADRGDRPRPIRSRPPPPVTAGSLLPGRLLLAGRPALCFLVARSVPLGEPVKGLGGRWLSGKGRPGARGKFVFGPAIRGFYGRGGTFNCWEGVECGPGEDFIVSYSGGPAGNPAKGGGSSLLAVLIAVSQERKQRGDSGAGPHSDRRGAGDMAGATLPGQRGIPGVGMGGAIFQKFRVVFPALGTRTFEKYRPGPLLLQGPIRPRKTAGVRGRGVGGERGRGGGVLKRIAPLDWRAPNPTPRAEIFEKTGDKGDKKAAHLSWPGGASRRALAGLLLIWLA